MKTHTHAAVRLKWLKFAPDGSAPRPSRFAVPAKFDHQGDDWRSDSWSLVVEHDRTGDARVPQNVDVHFLADSAPVDWLVPGRKFVLFDGAEPLAECVVL
jgi:hypothetical protein